MTLCTEVQASRAAKIYLTPEELVARYRGRVTIESLSNWRSKSTGPVWTRIGNRILYWLDDVLAWESEQRRGSTKGAR